MSKSKPCPLAELQPGFRLWLSRRSGGVFGPGKCRLLEAIHREGSLRAAADSLGISYRKAWGDLRDAEQALGVSFLTRTRGGAKGGQSSLNDTGKKWCAGYRRFEAKIEKSVGKAFARWLSEMEK